MAKTALPRQPRVLGGRKTIGIVASLYNDRFVDAMIEAAKAEINTVAPTTVVPLYRVPGAYEIPVTAEFIAQRAKVDVIMALGVVIRGDTGHADLVANSVATSLQEIAARHLTPVINEVLLLDDEDQAEERCFGTRMNRGTEAARAALSMAELFNKLNITYPPAKG